MPDRITGRALAVTRALLFSNDRMWKLEKWSKEDVAEMRKKGLDLQSMPWDEIVRNTPRYWLVWTNFQRVVMRELEEQYPNDEERSRLVAPVLHAARWSMDLILEQAIRES